MSNFYELSMNDFKNLAKDLSKAGFSRALAGYKVYEKSVVKMDYVEYDRNPKMACGGNLMNYLFVDMFYWQLFNNPARKKVSIKEVMKDLVNRSNLLLNEKHNFDKKNYDQNIEIVIDFMSSNIEVSVDLLTPVSTIYEVAKINLSDLCEYKGAKNESI